MITIYKTAYTGLIAQVFIINAPALFNVSFGLLKPILSESANEKIKIIGKQYHKQLFEICDKSVLPDFLGGDVKDVYPEVDAKYAPWKDWCHYMVNQKKN